MAADDRHTNCPFIFLYKLRICDMLKIVDEFSFTQQGVFSNSNRMTITHTRTSAGKYTQRKNNAYLQNLLISVLWGDTQRFVVNLQQTVKIGVKFRVDVFMNQLPLLPLHQLGAVVVKFALKHKGNIQENNVKSEVIVNCL